MHRNSPLSPACWRNTQCEVRDNAQHCVQGGHSVSLAELIVVPELPGSGTLIFVLTRCKGPSCAAPYVLQVTQEVAHVIQLEASKVWGRAAQHFVYECACC